MSIEQKNVLLLLFDGFNTLDVNGPLDVICNHGLRENVPGDPNWNPFKIFVAADSIRTVTAFEFIQAYPTISYDDARNLIAKKEIDVLMVPGYSGQPDVLEAMKERNDPIFGIIKEFLHQDSEDKERWLISICVGALINAWAGVFNGLEATTHWACVKNGALAKASRHKAKVVLKRWVDAGRQPNGVRILSSGGISCGLDAMLYFLSQVFDVATAQRVARTMDYVWNGGPPQPPDKPITSQ